MSCSTVCAVPGTGNSGFPFSWGVCSKPRKVPSRPQVGWRRCFRLTELERNTVDVEPVRHCGCTRPSRSGRFCPCLRSAAPPGFRFPPPPRGWVCSPIWVSPASSRVGASLDAGEALGVRPEPLGAACSGPLPPGSPGADSVRLVVASAQRQARIREGPPQERGQAELRRPTLQVPDIQLLTLHLDDSHGVQPLSLGHALAELVSLELREDDVFVRADEENLFALLQGVFPPPLHRASLVAALRRHEHVDLDRSRQMDSMAATRRRSGSRASRRR